MENKNFTPDYNLNKFDIFSSLFSIVNEGHSTNEINKNIANYLLKNLNNLGNLTIYDVAEECYVSRSSIHRFLKQIGVDQFSNLVRFVQDSQQHYSAYHKYANHDNFPLHLQQMMEEMMQSIAGIADDAKVRQLVQMVHDYERVFILVADGSSSAPLQFQEEMMSIGKLIYVYTSSNVDEESFAQLSAHDLLIVCSITGNYAFAVTKDLTGVRSPKVLITSNHADAFKGHYSHIIYMSENNGDNRPYAFLGNRNVYTKYGLIFFFDIIFSQYLQEYASDVIASDTK